jgi:hypothetical protein
VVEANPIRVVQGSDPLETAHKLVQIVEPVYERLDAVLQRVPAVRMEAQRSDPMPGVE